jgi:hypothetical protein
MQLAIKTRVMEGGSEDRRARCFFLKSEFGKKNSEKAIKKFALRRSRGILQQVPGGFSSR